MQSNQNSNALTQPLAEEHKTGMPIMADNPLWFHQLQDLLRQSFLIFNVYSRQPEDMQIVTQAFGMVLKKHSIERITESFQIWMEKSSAMPTPADILANLPPNKRKAVKATPDLIRAFPSRYKAADDTVFLFDDEPEYYLYD